MNWNDLVRLVDENSRARGNAEGFNDAQYAARTALKVVEEACEVQAHIGLPLTQDAYQLLEEKRWVMTSARRLFNDRESWTHPDPSLDWQTDSEMADVLICCLVYSAARKVDLAELALEKVKRDRLRRAK